MTKKKEIVGRDLLFEAPENESTPCPFSFREIKVTCLFVRLSVPARPLDLIPQGPPFLLHKCVCVYRLSSIS